MPGSEAQYPAEKRRNRKQAKLERKMREREEKDKGRLEEEHNAGQDLMAAMGFSGCGGK